MGTARRISTARRIARATEEVVLTVLSILGALCVVLVVLALVFDVTLIMFKTGSMSPTIPAGSVAIVRRVPAAEVKVGDVVTVDRPGQLPVTHRVTSVTAGPTADQRVFTLKGDANTSEDAAPYTVSTVRITLASVPGLALVIVRLSNPYVLGAITIGASLLVTWAFWPRDGGRSGEKGPSLPAAAAQTAIVRGTYLTLVSLPDPRMAMMGPGETVHWQVGVSADAPDPGTVSVGLSATGDASMGLTAAAAACSVQWVDGVCTGRSWPLPGLDPLPIDGAERELLTMPSDEERWVLLAVTMPPTARPVPGAGVSALLHASGQGDSLSVGPGGLAGTGGPSARWSLLLALGAITSGLALALRAKQQNHRDIGDTDKAEGRP